MSKAITVIDGKEYENVGTHETHCCKRHGCKYGKKKHCAVASGAVVQRYACEYCTSSGTLKARIASLQEELVWTESLEARGLNVSGYDEDYGY